MFVTTYALKEEFYVKFLIRCYIKSVVLQFRPQKSMERRRVAIIMVIVMAIVMVRLVMMVIMTISTENFVFVLYIEII